MDLIFESIMTILIDDGNVYRQNNIDDIEGGLFTYDVLHGGAGTQKRIIWLRPCKAQ